MTLQVGMHRSDEDGWVMVDALDTAADGSVVGYHLIGPKGVESYLSADNIGSGWEAPHGWENGR